jgi:hypothetical protein
MFTLEFNRVSLLRCQLLIGRHDFVVIADRTILGIRVFLLLNRHLLLNNSCDSTDLLHHGFGELFSLSLLPTVRILFLMLGRR